MGIDSCGMIISAVHQEEGVEKLHCLMVDERIPVGAKLYQNSKKLTDMKNRNSADNERIIDLFKRAVTIKSHGPSDCRQNGSRYHVREPFFCPFPVFKSKFYAGKEKLQ